MSDRFGKNFENNGAAEFLGKIIGFLFARRDLCPNSAHGS